MQAESKISLCSYARSRLEADADALALRWLTALKARLPVEPTRIFPQQTLLNHVPLLLRRMAAALDDEDPLGAEGVREELASIARLRRSQGYGMAELVTEFDVLAAVASEALEGYLSDWEGPVPVRDVMRVATRLRDVIEGMSRITVEVLELEQRSDALQHDWLLDTFGRAVGHELRNRLNAVHLLLEVWKREAEQAESGARIRELQERLKTVERVVEDVFAVAIVHNRIDPGEHAFRPLARVVANACETVREHADSRGVKLVADPELPIFAVDGMRVQLVLVNLLNNAIKYCQSREDRWVRISATRIGDGEWQVSVADNGIGIPPRDQERIFQANERASAPHDVPGEGIGLGLARKAVEQLRGRIWVESEPERGSTFHFTLREPAETL